MPSLNIPARTIAQGVSVFGPAPTGAGLSGMELDLDVANIVAPCTFRLEIAFNGVDYQTVAEQTVSHPPMDRQGNPVVPPIMRWAANFGNTVAGPILTTAASRARITVDNSQAFDTAGGTLITQ